MSEYRRKKTEGLRLRKDRNLSLGAGILIDSFLKGLGLSERKMNYGFVGNRKPVFIGLPEVHFSISHSDKIAIAAFSDSEIGCDVEKITKANLSLAKRFFCREEYDLLVKEEDPEKRDLLFFRLWTLKESFVKASGYGMELPMNSFLIRLEDGGVSVECETVKYSFEFHEYSCIPGFCAAYCSEGKHPCPEPRKIDPVLF